jgi:hypothetical protein
MAERHHAFGWTAQQASGTILPFNEQPICHFPDNMAGRDFRMITETKRLQFKANLLHCGRSCT